MIDTLIKELDKFRDEAMRIYEEVSELPSKHIAQTIVSVAMLAVNLIVKRVVKETTIESRICYVLTNKEGDRFIDFERKIATANPRFARSTSIVEEIREVLEDDKSLCKELGCIYPAKLSMITYLEKEK